MAFWKIARKIKYSPGVSERFKTLDAYDRLRLGTFYDHITQAFEDEYAGNEYVKLRDRRPGNIWNGASLLVDQLAGLLWGDEQMPIVRTYIGDKPSEADRQAELGIQHLSEKLNLDSVMDNVTTTASSGSAAIIFRATRTGVNIEVIAGKECTPHFDDRDPDFLVSLDQCYPTTGAALAEMGYQIKQEDLDQPFWFKLSFDSETETRYKPMRDDEFQLLGQIVQGRRVQWEIDPARTWAHGWPELPVLWVKSPARGVARIDGECLFGKIVDILVSIDYNLSQIERGFRYTADPMLAITGGEIKAGSYPAAYTPTAAKTPATDSKGKVIKSAAHILPVEPGGSAEMLEISGQGLDKFREFVKTLREWGLEIAGGIKSDASTTKGIESGRALEMLYQSLILVIKRWRVALGNMCYLPLIRLLLVGIQDGVIAVEGVDTPPPDTQMRLVWPTWMTPSGADLLATANAWQTLAGGSAREPRPLLPWQTITRLAGGNLGMTDVSTLVDELKKQLDGEADQEQEDADAEADRQTDSQIAVVKAKPVPKPAATTTKTKPKKKAVTKK